MISFSISQLNRSHFKFSIPILLAMAVPMARAQVATLYVANRGVTMKLRFGRKAFTQLRLGAILNLSQRVEAVVRRGREFIQRGG